MDLLSFMTQWPLVNLLLLVAMSLYVLSKARRYASALLFFLSLLPLISLQLGTYLFIGLESYHAGPLLIVLGITLIPICMTPLSHVLGRQPQNTKATFWKLYYAAQMILTAAIAVAIFRGSVIEWVTGILNQPVILIQRSHRFIFLNTIVSCAVILLCYENTFKSAGRFSAETLKCIFIAFLGFIVYFFYFSSHVVLTSYISHAVLVSGSGVISIGILLVVYSLLKYPLWEVKVTVSRRLVFGSLSVTAFVLYMLISGTLLSLLESVKPHGYNIFLPTVIFALTASFLVFYLSPKTKRTFEIFISRHLFKNKYDYRELWMKFSEKLSGSVNREDLLSKVGEFIADSMFVGQVAIWLRAPNSDTFTLEYSHQPIPNTAVTQLSARYSFVNPSSATISALPRRDKEDAHATLQIDNADILTALGIHRTMPVERGNDVLGVLGVGGNDSERQASAEDDRLLVSISNQLAHLLMNQRLSEELMLSREWESFNRLSSFVIHDLKNLATLQSMTLENAKELGSNPSFLSDAFATFSQTTDKMINLIASLSVRRGQFSLNKRPVNLVEILSSTFEELKIDQRGGLTITTTYPPKDQPPMIAGDPELLKKVFTNLLLNAIQSLPRGQGNVDITVAHPGNGKIRTGIKDTGCGMPPEQIKNLFRPFQTTKKNGMGIGLCHTRSIVEVHGGRIYIESQPNAGTQVEIEFPTL